MRFRGRVNGRVRDFSVPRHKEIRPGTLNEIIRQTGLPRELFE